MKLSPKLGIVPVPVPSLDCRSGEGSLRGFLGGVSRPRGRGTPSLLDAELGVVGEVNDEANERVGGRYDGSVSTMGVFLSKNARIRVGKTDARIYGQTAETIPGRV